MPADTYSSILGLLQMGTGNDPTTWGDNANNSIFAVIEDALAGVANHAVTGGTLNLASTTPPAGISSAVEYVQAFTGVLTSNQTVIVPNTPKFWSVFNATTGAFTLRFKTANGSGTLIPQGTACTVGCLGNDLVIRVGHNTGEIFMHGGGTVPPGALACDGSAVSRTDYDELYAALGTTWGEGDGFTTFNLPNLVNRFPRASGSTAVGTLQADQFGPHTHPGTVAVNTTTGTESAQHNHHLVGSTGGQSADHSHAYTLLVAGGSEWSSGGVRASLAGHDDTAVVQTGGASTNHTHSFSTTSTGASSDHTHAYGGAFGFTTDPTGGETRPDAAVVLMCVWI